MLGCGMSLEQLTELRAAFADRGDDDDFNRWWALVEAITSDIDGDPDASEQERELLVELRGDVSQLIHDVREGAPSPDVVRARVSASALRSSISERTIGPNGG